MTLTSNIVAGQDDDAVVVEGFDLEVFDLRQTCLVRFVTAS